MNRIFVIALAGSFIGIAAPTLVGCSGDSGTGAPGGDVDSGTPLEDSATPQADAGNPPQVDSASPGVDAPSANDSASPPSDASKPSGDGALGAFGDTCQQNSDCQSNMCEPFRQQSIMLCTKACTAATQATDCPAPPSAGTCTPKNYCRFN